MADEETRYEAEDRARQDVSQAAQQTAQAAAQAAQRAEQTAQAIAQEVQAVKQSLESAQAASRGVGAETSGATVETEISPASISKAWAANVKRSYDAYQAEDLESLRQARMTTQKLADAHLDHVRDLQLQQVRMHSLAVENDNAMSKQHLAHRDLATDRTWNVDEVARLVTNSAAFQDAIAAGVIDTLQRSVDKTEK